MPKFVDDEILEALKDYNFQEDTSKFFENLTDVKVKEILQNEPEDLLTR